MENILGKMKKMDDSNDSYKQVAQDGKWQLEKDADGRVALYQDYEQNPKLKRLCREPDTVEEVIQPTHKKEDIEDSEKETEGETIGEIKPEREL